MLSAAHHDKLAPPNWTPGYAYCRHLIWDGAGHSRIIQNECKAISHSLSRVLGLLYGAPNHPWCTAKTGVLNLTPLVMLEVLNQNCNIEYKTFTTYHVVPFLLEISIQFGTFLAFPVHHASQLHLSVGTRAEELIREHVAMSSAVYHLQGLMLSFGAGQSTFLITPVSHCVKMIGKIGLWYHTCSEERPTEKTLLRCWLILLLLHHCVLFSLSWMREYIRVRFAWVAGGLQRMRRVLVLRVRQGSTRLRANYFAVPAIIVVGEPIARRLRAASGKINLVATTFIRAVR